MALSDAPQCTATAKSTGKRCELPAIKGREVCRLHGGKTPRGEASPHFKHGRFSEYLPERLVKIYEAVEADNEHSILSRNIQLRETFLREKLAMLDNAPDSAQTWQELRKVADDLTAHFTDEKYGLCHVDILKLERLIDEKEAYHKAVAELRDEMAEQRKDKQAISAIEYRGENAITAKELMVFMGAVLHVINNTVTNQAERIRIHEQIDGLFSSTPKRMESNVQADND